MWNDINPSDFVEIHGIFRPNPLADSLTIIDRLLGMMQLLGSVIPNNTSRSTSRSQRGQNPPTATRTIDKEQLKQMEQIRKFFSGILKDIEGEQVKTFVVDFIGLADYRAVSLLYLDYLRDQTMKELSYKEYRMLGKVVRKLDKDETEVINLLIGTGLGSMGQQSLEQMLAGLSAMPGMNLPEIQTEVEGPALEIVPIAISV